MPVNAARDILIAAYAMTGVVGVVGYLPTIRDLLLEKPSACGHSYRIWTATSVVAVLYAVFVVGDVLLSVVATANMVCCAVILVLSERMRKACEAIDDSPADEG